MKKRFVRNTSTEKRVTERDLMIVRHLFLARYLTNQMVNRLVFTPTTFSTCKQRLRVLFDLGYIRKRQAFPNEKDVYFWPKGSALCGAAW